MMRIRNPGKINEHLWYLGWMESSVYLLQGSREAILINGGLACLVPEILRQFETFGIDESKITKILILHSHFDHVGIIPFFKRRFPNLEIYGSPRALDVLAKPKVIQSINSANRDAAKALGFSHLYESYDLDWSPIVGGVPIKEGFTMDIGDLEVVFFETPGHSPCSISAYVPKLKVLFPSEAAGLPWGRKIITYGTSSYSDFEVSIQKLRDLPVECICSDHYGYVAGDEAYGFVEQSIAVARERRLLMQELYQRTGSVDLAARELAVRFKDENAVGIVPEDIFVEAHRNMVINVTGQ